MRRRGPALTEHRGTRSSTRHAVSLAITIRVGSRTIETRTTNLSLGGVCVALEEKLPIGANVRIVFSVPTHTIEIDGDVRWSGDSETGVQFGGLRARDVWELNRYFDELARGR
jgi:hypothetical protein